MTIYRYHAFNNWAARLCEGEDETDTITFGFELEVEKRINPSDYVDCEDMSDIINERFSDLFVCEHDGSLSNGFEIISQPMSMKWYLTNISKFKELLSLLLQHQFISHNSGNCGLHVHYGREALGFDTAERMKFLNKGLSLADFDKINKMKKEDTIYNVLLICEKFYEELSKISGRNRYGFCQFIISESERTQPLNRELIKERKDNRVRYRVVNLCNAKTVEIRIMRGTLLWEAFDTRIRLLYNIIDSAKKAMGLITFDKIAFLNQSDEIINQMKNYFIGRGVEDLTKTKLMIGLENKEYRVENTNFILKNE